MAFNTSGVFGSLLEDALENTTAYDLPGDSHKVALFDNVTVPDVDATAGNNIYGSGTWTTGNECSDSTNWDAGGEPLPTPTLVRATGVLTFDGEDVSQGGASCTLADVYGSAIFDTTVTNAGICFNDFGGVQAVTSGDFTIQWHANGIFTITFTAS